jgi:hypothetical protein
MLPLFIPKSNLSMVILPSVINFGVEWSESLAPYCANFDEGAFDYNGCEKEWPGRGFECPVCKCPCCRACLPEEAQRCKNCDMFKASYLKLQEIEAAQAPALTEEPQE